MDNNSGKFTCAITCWVIATLFGAIVAAVLMAMGGWTFLQAAFIGAIAFAVLGALLSLTLCRELPHLSEIRAVSAPAAPVSQRTEPSAATKSAQATAAAAMDTVAAGSAEPVPAPKPKVAPKKAAPKAEPAAAQDGPGTKPAGLSAARASGADDLKKIKGIGPKLEILCNELGFYHYDQIAAWSANEVAWVDQNLQGFKGRVTRDTWVDQAKLLAAGGETEFSKKVDKGDVY